MPNDINQLSAAIKKLAEGKFEVVLDPDCFSGPYYDIAVNINRLAVMVGELNSFATALSVGEISVPSPPRHNFLAGGLKSLQTNLKHILWQAEQVSKGDLGQRVDYMGELSNVFNMMYMQLEERSDMLVKKHTTMINAFDHIDNIIIIYRKEPREILFLNRRAKQLFMGDGDGDAGENAAHLQALLTQQEPNPRPKEIFFAPTHEWYSIVSTQIEWMDDVSAIMVLCQNITYNKIHEEQLMKIASIDVLTGCYTRRAGLERLQGEIASLPIDTTISLCFIDLDDFKHINDNFGHAQGDEALKTIGQKLMGSVRKSDMVVRYGGDEFLVILCPGDKRLAQNAIDRVQNDLAEYNMTSGMPYELNFSYGIAQAVIGDGRTAEQIIAESDEQMYENKRKKNPHIKRNTTSKIDRK